MSESNKFRFLSLFGANYQAINDGIQSAVDEAKNILDNIQRSLETEPEFIKVKSDFDNCNISEEKKTTLPNEEFEIYKYYHEKTADRDCNFYFGFFYGPHLNEYFAVKEIIEPRIYFVTGLWILHSQQMDKYSVKNKEILQRINTNDNYYYLNPEPVPVSADVDIEVYKSQTLSAFKEAMAFLNFLEKS